jgi:hypothetical protein
MRNTKLALPFFPHTIVTQARRHGRTAGLLDMLRGADGSIYRSHGDWSNETHRTIAVITRNPEQYKDFPDIKIIDPDDRKRPLGADPFRYIDPTEID